MTTFLAVPSKAQKGTRLPVGLELSIDTLSAFLKRIYDFAPFFV